MKNKAFGFYTAALTLILTVATLVVVLIYGSKGGVVNSLVPIALAQPPFARSLSSSVRKSGPILPASLPPPCWLTP